MISYTPLSCSMNEENRSAYSLDYTVLRVLHCKSYIENEQLLVVAWNYSIVGI
jgi:hypothetical protein